MRNLPQVKVGDVLTVAYQESLAWEVKKPGEATPGAELVAGAARALVGRTATPSPAMAPRSFFSTARTARRRKRVGLPPVSMRLMAVVNTSATVLTRPGMAESGHCV